MVLVAAVTVSAGAAVEVDADAGLRAVLARVVEANERWERLAGQLRQSGRDSVRILRCRYCWPESPIPILEMTSGWRLCVKRVLRLSPCYSMSWTLSWDRSVRAIPSKLLGVKSDGRCGPG